MSTQALNRALLARQRLLARAPLPAGGDRATHVIGELGELLFGPLSARDRDALEAEGERLLSFAAAEAGARDIRYAPVA